MRKMGGKISRESFPGKFPNLRENGISSILGSMYRILKVIKLIESQKLNFKTAIIYLELAIWENEMP